MMEKHNVPPDLAASSLFIFPLFFPPLRVEEQRGIPWWGWLLIVIGLLVVVALLVGWWSRRRAKSEALPQVRAEAAPSAPDDLTRIEGIGPKIAGLLREAGITTFAQLAEADVERLRRILDEARLLQIADPGTWPEQARLAASGQWEALKALQEELRGGRRA